MLQFISYDRHIKYLIYYIINRANRKRYKLKELERYTLHVYT